MESSSAERTLVRGTWVTNRAVATGKGVCCCAITVHGFISIVFRTVTGTPLQKHMAALNAGLKNAQGIDQSGSRTSCCKNMRL